MNRLTSIFRQTATLIDRWHWLLLALVAPFLVFPAPSRVLVLCVVPGLWLVAWLAGREPLPRTPLNGTLLLMFFMVLVSLWATFDMVYSLPKISGILLGLGIFFAVVRVSESLRGWIFSLLAFLAIGMGIAMLGVFGTSWFSSKIGVFDAITSRLPKFITGLQGAESGFHPNEVAGALAWVLPLMLAISVALFFALRPQKIADAGFQSKNWPPMLRGWRLGGMVTLWLAATFFVTVVFLLSQSRGGYIGLAVTLAAMTLLALPPRWRRYSLALLALVAVVAGILFFSRWESVRVWVTGSNLTNDPALSLTTFEGRLELWSRALYGIQDFPFTGMGMNTFRKVLPVLYPLFTISPEFDIGHAHNELLQSALDLGIPGLIAFLALYIGAFWMLADIWKRNTDHWSLFTGHCSLFTVHSSLSTRFLTLGLGGGLLAHFLYGLTDAVALGAKPGLLFWMLLGLIAGLHRQVERQSSTSAQNGLLE